MNQNSGLLGISVRDVAFTEAKQCCFGALAKLVVGARGIDHALDGLWGRYAELR